MSNSANPIVFPPELASRILWSPTIYQSINDDAGSLSQASYALVTPELQSRTSPCSVEENSIEGNENSVEDMRGSEVSAESGSPAPGAPACGISELVQAINASDVKIPSGTKGIVPSDVGAASTCEETILANPQDDFAIPELPRKILEELGAHVSYKFSSVIQMESVKAHKSFHDEKKPIVEPIVQLYYPQDGCHEIIDEAVKAVAKAQNAEILTLDALALASTESNIFGDEFRDVLSALYKNPILPEEKKEVEESDEAKKRRREKEEKETKEKDEELQAIFDALLSLRASQNLQDTGATTKKRIIYLRDFGSIAKVASPLILRLLRATHTRRTAKFSDNIGSEDLVQPTLLVLGYSISIGTSNIPESAFVHGDDALRKALPSIGAESLVQRLVTLPPISSRVFLGYLSVTSNLHPLLSSKVFTFNGSTFSLGSFDLTSTLSMSIFLDGLEKKSFSELEKKLRGRRKTDIARAWLRIRFGLRQRSVSCDDVITFLEKDVDLQNVLAGDEEEEGKSKSEGVRRGTEGLRADSNKSNEPRRGPYIGEELLTRLAKLTNSSVLIALDQAVTIALGMEKSVQSPEGVSQVPLPAVSKALQILVKNYKSRTKWWNDQGKEKDNDNDKHDDKDKDPVVEGVEKASDLTSHEKKLLSCIVDPKELTTSFDDICISEKTIESLRTIISLPLRFPNAFKSGVLGRESMGGVLLYGPPGTGKTMVCRAVARECGARMLVIKPSDIMNCYVGESEKYVKAVFLLAYRLAPCLIFIDELDAVFAKRRGDDKKWVRDVLAEFLQSMDGLKSAKTNKDAGVIVIGATNRPQDIDEAVIRRLPSRMIVDAPEEKQRKRILELHLRGEALDPDVNLDEVATKTKNYSGSDLKNLCVAAAIASVKDAIGALTWEPLKPSDAPRYGEDTTDQSKNKDDETSEVNEKINKRTLKMKHLTAGTAEVSGSLSSTTGQDDLQRWHSQYGTMASSRPNYGAVGAGNFAGGSSYGASGGYGTNPGTGKGSYGLGGNVTAGSSRYDSGANRYGVGAGSGYGAPNGTFANGVGGSLNTPGTVDFNSAVGTPYSRNPDAISGASVPRAPYGLNTGSGLGPSSGGYSRSSSANRNENTSLPSTKFGGDAADSAVPRYSSKAGRYGAGGNLGGGLGSPGSSGFTVSPFAGGNGSGNNMQEGPHASIEPVDEKYHPGT